MKSVITIGRSSHCDIIVPGESISREHARISIVGGNYVYEDVGKNGSVIGGRVLHGEKIVVAAGTDILLAGKIPLPWAQVYAMLPLRGVRPYDEETHVAPVNDGGRSGGYVVNDSGRGGGYVVNDSIPVGWGILAFIIPLAGWIMYFCWKDEHPKRASQASTIAWISVALGFISSLAAM